METGVVIPWSVIFTGFSLWIIYPVVLCDSSMFIACEWGIWVDCAVCVMGGVHPIGQNPEAMSTAVVKL